MNSANLVKIAFETFAKISLKISVLGSYTLIDDPYRCTDGVKLSV